VAFINGTANSDTLNGNDDEVDHIHGFTGDDNLSGLGGDDDLDGGGGDDQLLGGDGNDILNASSGDDRLVGDRGADRLIGGSGSDTLLGGADNDTVIGGEGTDFVSGDAGADILVGDLEPSRGFPPLGQLAIDLFVWEAIDGSDDDRILDFAPGVDILRLFFCSEFTTVQDLLATSSGDTLLSIPTFDGGTATLTLAGVDPSQLTARDFHLVDNSGGEADALTGGTGADLLIGRLGNDTLAGAAGNDRLFGEQGNDILRGGAGADRLDGGSGTDLVSYFGATTAVTVNLATGKGANGEAQGDTYVRVENVSGGKAGDTIIGNAAGNALNGFEGRDVLTGGAGADRFTVSALGHSAVGANADRITDFSHAQGDRIDLAAIDARSTAAGDQAFSFVGAAAYSGAAGELRFSQAGGVTTVAGDVNGDKVSDFHIVLTGTIALGSGDFVL
jgi:Ca2+-binding RTX toxin-like protein